MIVCIHRHWFIAGLAALAEAFTQIEKTDERFWENPDTVDFHREVNKHIGFGAGAHRCLGSHLARMELRVTLEEWHLRVPSYQLAPGTELVYTAGLRQVENLDLVW